MVKPSGWWALWPSTWVEGLFCKMGGGHLMLGRGENIAHFVKKKSKQLMLGCEGVAYLAKKKLEVLNHSVFPESSGPSSSTVQLSAQAV